MLCFKYTKKYLFWNPKHSFLETKFHICEGIQKLEGYKNQYFCMSKNYTKFFTCKGIQKLGGSKNIYFSIKTPRFRDKFFICEGIQKVGSYKNQYILYATNSLLVKEYRSLEVPKIRIFESTLLILKHCVQGRMHSRTKSTLKLRGGAFKYEGCFQNLKSALKLRCGGAFEHQKCSQTRMWGCF